MTLQVHKLEGCRPSALGHYLKALGVLRLVAEQADSEARGFWRDEHFQLVTRLSREELIQFFCLRYEPTPLVSPWNKGSGFMGADDVLVPIRASTASRFGPLRAGVEAATQVVQALSAADAAVREIKSEATRLKGAKEKEALRSSQEYRQRLATAEREFKRIKGDFIPVCRREWRGRHQQWLQAALVLADDLQPRFPSLLGTGGNDGRLDFTNNFYRRLGALFDLGSAEGAPREGAQGPLEAALFGGPTRGLERGAVGQFLPGGAGGANSTTGAMGEPLLNTWDFVLALEGALLFAASATQRLSTTAVRASAPFAVDSRAAGYGSAAPIDEGVRGEQWLPLWTEPWTHDALRAVLAEGRAQVGARHSRGPVELARSLARLGVARGIRAFERFGYLERNGQSNLAVPLGRWVVEPRPEADVLDDLQVWTAQLRRAARDERAPRSLVAAAQRLDDAILGALAHGGARRWQEVLLACVTIEDRLVASGTYTAQKRLRPIPALRPEWLAVADDGSPEFRLGAVLANAGRARSSGKRTEPDPVRRHWLPLDDRGDGFATGERGLRHDPAVVCAGRDPVEDLVRLVSRRIVESTPPALGATRGRHADPRDLAGLLTFGVDLTRCVGLGRAFMALSPDSAWSTTHRPPSMKEPPDDLWLLLRLAHLTEPLEKDRAIPVDLAILRALAAGNGAQAIRLAVRRLHGAGLAPTIQAGALSPQRARLLAASLAFPVSLTQLRRWAHELLPGRPGRDSTPTSEEPLHAR